MKEKKLSVVVYCASSTEIDKVYVHAAMRLGELLAKNGVTCINGAGKQGLMGALNDSIIHHGGKVKGVIPRFMVDAGWCHDLLNETVVTETIHERKACMAESSDAVIALPGGLGTLEELAEILTWKQLGLYSNPIILLNVNEYYDSLLQFLEQMIEEKFMNDGYRKMWQVAKTPEEALELLKNAPDWNPLFFKYSESREKM
jgi:uncharacterized protein (TIGR00730 family)